MSKMESKEIIKLVDLMIGPTTAVGETNIDNEIEKNIKNAIDVVNWILDGISESATTRHRPEYSMRNIGERAFSAMCEWKDWLDNRINMD